MKIYEHKDINLNLGGGNQKKEGYLNIDILNLPNVDIIHNLEEGIPLKDSTVEEIYSSHFLEHTRNPVFIFEEMYRVSKPNAIVRFKVPYFMSTGAFKDLTHNSFFTERTFEYFDKSCNKNLPEYKFKANFKVEKISYIWHNKALRLLPFKKAFFMKHFWNIANTMYVELRVVK